MCNPISLLSLGRVSGLQTLSLLKIKSQAEVTENNKLLPANNENDRELKVIANLLRLQQKQSKLPDAKDIIEKFKKGEIDPRNLKKGEELTLNLAGKDYTFKIEKDGEFTCKVKGRDDSVRIYQGKNGYGEDCMRR